MPMPLDNNHMNALQEYWGEPFKDKFVKQIIAAKDSIFSEMRDKLHVTTNQDVRAYSMAKKRGLVV
jgi:hypothetical protein